MNSSGKDFRANARNFEQLFSRTLSYAGTAPGFNNIERGFRGTLSPNQVPELIHLIVLHPDCILARHKGVMIERITLRA
jgi:hypothetical protein